MADWWSQSRIEPIQVYGPTMKTSSSPMTSGGSSSAQSTPASQILGNGSRSRAIIHASGVQKQISTARVTPPDSTDVSSGSRSPAPVSADQMSPGDIRVMSVITGPSSATQMTAAPTSDKAADIERTLGARPPLPLKPLGVVRDASFPRPGPPRSKPAG